MLLVVLSNSALMFKYTQSYLFVQVYLKFLLVDENHGATLFGKHKAEFLKGASKIPALELDDRLFTMYLLFPTQEPLAQHLWESDH